MKKTLASLLIASIVLSSYGSAQFLEGGYMTPTSSTINGNQRYLHQTKKVNNDYFDQDSCPGAYNESRMYLGKDLDGDGNKDLGVPYYLRDNFLYKTDRSSDVKVALLTVHMPAPNTYRSRGSDVEFTTSAGGSNMLSVLQGNAPLDIASTRAWFRQSKVAPANNRVRGVESEPLLIEAPSSKSVSDDKMQIAYTVRYAGYDSVDTNSPQTNDYRAYLLPNNDANNFDGLTNRDHLRWMKHPIVDNNRYGPNFPGDFVQSSILQSTQSIKRQAEQSHTRECNNIYVSWCGNGYIDKSGDTPKKPGATDRPIALPAGGGINETCDPGSNLASFTDDVMPGGVVATATYNCTATCTENRVTSPTPPTIIKRQRNNTTNTPAAPAYQTTDIQYASGQEVEFEITVNNPNTTDLVGNYEIFDSQYSAGLENIQLIALSNGQLVSSCGVTTTSRTVACTLSVLKPGNTVLTFKGTLRNTVRTDNTVSLRKTDGGNQTTIMTAPTVYQNPTVIPPVIPTITMDKKVKTTASANYRDAIDGAPRGTENKIEVITGQTISYQIIISKTAGIATGVTFTDTLPGDFAPATYSIDGGIAQAYTSQTFTTSLDSYFNTTNATSVKFEFFGTIKVNPINRNLIRNVARVTSLNTYTWAGGIGATSIYTPTGLEDLADVYVATDYTVYTPVLSIFKRDAPGVNASQSQLVDEMTVLPATEHIYRIQFKNTGNGVTTSPVTITDAMPAGVICKTFRYKKRNAVDPNMRSASMPCNTTTNFSYVLPDALPANMPTPSELEIVTQIDANITAGRIPNTATLTYAGLEISDPAYIIIPLINPDFGIQKFVNETSVVPGQSLTYRLVFSNKTSRPIAQYAIMDKLPSTVTYDTSFTPTLTMGTSTTNLPSPIFSDNNTVISRGCSQGLQCPLLGNGSGTITFKVKVN